MDFCLFLFVCTSYKATFLNRSDNTWRHLRLHILSPFSPSSALPATYFPCRIHRLDSPHSHVRVCVANTRAYMRLSCGRFCTCFVLSARSCVCVCSSPRGYIFRTFPSLLYTWSMFAILMGPSSVTFSTHFIASAHSRVCVCSYVSQSAHGYIFRTFRSSLLQHISFLYICTLSHTRFCSRFHCHYYEVHFPYIRK
jgi:hypothetical protein